MKWKIEIDGEVPYEGTPVHLVQSVDSQHQVEAAVSDFVRAVLSAGYVDIKLHIYRELS